MQHTFAFGIKVTNKKLLSSCFMSPMIYFYTDIQWTLFIRLIDLNHTKSKVHSYSNEHTLLV